MGPVRYEVGDRRPLASRQTRLAQLAADWLARRHVSPNAISLAGMFFGCAGGALLAFTRCSLPTLSRAAWLAAAAAIQLRLLCNLLDGMVAVQTRSASRIGELYNEIPDRISDPAMLIGAGYALGGLPVLGFVAACLALLTAYVRAVGKTVGAGQEYCGPMAKQQRVFVITLVAVGGAFLPGRWQPTLGGGVGLAAMGLVVIIIGCLVTVLRRLLRIKRQLEWPTV